MFCSRHLTDREKLYVAELAEVASDDSVELKVGSSSHKAPESLDSLEVCFDECVVEE